MVMKELLIGIAANAIVSIVWYLLRRRGNKSQKEKEMNEKPINPDVKTKKGRTSKIPPEDSKNGNGETSGKNPKKIVKPDENIPPPNDQESEKNKIPLEEIFPPDTVSPINQNDDSQNEEFWYKKLDELDREFRKKEEV